jgi:hypothetical protein
MNFVEKAGRTRPLGKYNSRQEDNTKMDFKDTGWEGVDRIHITQDRVQCWIVVNTNELLGPKRDGQFLDHLSEYQLLKKELQCGVRIS